MNDEHRTEQALFNKLDDEFNFVIDLAATRKNRMVAKYISPKTNSLAVDWLAYGGLNHFWRWLNPPYSRGLIDQFMAKTCAEAGKGTHVVALVRLDPTADWFKSFVNNKAAEIRLLAHRVRFQDQPSAYNWPCCVAIYPGRLSRKSRYRSWTWRDE